MIAKLFFFSFFLHSWNIDKVLYTFIMETQLLSASLSNSINTTEGQRKLITFRCGTFTDQKMYPVTEFILFNIKIISILQKWHTWTHRWEKIELRDKDSNWLFANQTVWRKISRLQSIVLSCAEPLTSYLLYTFNACRCLFNTYQGSYWKHSAAI